MFLDDLTRKLDLHHNRVILIPGNHDINRDACKAYFRLQKEKTGEEPPPPFWPKWEYFAKFFRRFYPGKAQFTKKQPWTLFKIPELKVAVAGLNSTMQESHRKEDHHGKVGKEQLRWFADCLADFKKQGWLRIGAIHHNVRRGAADDDEHLKDIDLLRDRLHGLLNLLLHGHTHKGDWDVLEENVPVLATGSTALKDADLPHGLTNQYQIVRIQREQVTRWCRAYDRNREKWVGDNRARPDGDDWRYAKNVSFTDVFTTFPNDKEKKQKTTSVSLIGQSFVWYVLTLMIGLSPIWIILLFSYAQPPEFPLKGLVTNDGLLFSIGLTASLSVLTASLMLDYHLFGKTVSHFLAKIVFYVVPVFIIIGCIAVALFSALYENNQPELLDNEFISISTYIIMTISAVYAILIKR